MRLIDTDVLINEIRASLSYKDYEWSMYADDFIESLNSAPTIKTKQIKYYDDDENVWKIGEVIVG